VLHVSVVYGSDSGRNSLGTSVKIVSRSDDFESGNIVCGWKSFIALVAGGRNGGSDPVSLRTASISA